jgi:PAS domain S-box-containing protein
MDALVRILHLEDNSTDAEFLRSLLDENGVDAEIIRVDTEAQYLDMLSHREFDLIVSDFSLPSFDGSAALKYARDLRPEVPFIFVSGTIGEEAAITSLLNGATDYVLKGRMERLVPAVRRAISEQQERKARAHAEKALRQSEESFRHLFYTNPLPMWVYDSDTLEFLEVNNTAVQKYGYTREQFLRMRVTDIRPKEDRGKFEEDFSRNRETVSHLRNSRHVLNDGRIIDVDMTWHALDFAGRNAAMVVAMDVTERNRAEQALRESEARFRLISENVEDLIALIDLQGRRTYASPSYRRILGDPAKLLGTYFYNSIHPDDRDRIRRSFEETVRTGLGRREEYRIMSQDGGIRHVESQGSVIRDGNGNIKNVVLVSRDVTEKKQLEEQFLRAQRLESLGTLAGGIAHDLNNVLAPILLALAILKESVTSENGLRTLRTLEASAQRGSQVVKQILTFARGMKGERGLFQPRHTIQETAAIIRETFPRSIDIQEDIARDLWTIQGDATQLHQLMMNLCVNARDAMPSGGKLSLSAENTTLTSGNAPASAGGRTGQFVKVTISDTGTGIPPKVLDRMFDPFFTTKPQGKGTGLGLSTVHSIVKGHEGFIDITTEVGKGSTFDIYLPAAGVEEPVARPVKGIGLIHGNGELVLVVDDEASIREISRQTLEASGYRVITASNGAEAVALYRSRGNDISLVVSDLMMPEMDGSRTFDVIRSMNPTVKILGSSGLVGGMDSEGKSGPRLDDVLQKPYTTDELLRKVQGLLAHHSSSRKD